MGIFADHTFEDSKQVGAQRQKKHAKRHTMTVDAQGNCKRNTKELQRDTELLQRDIKQRQRDTT